MRIVQVGLGQWGANHYRILKDMGMLSAVCDTDRKKVIDMEDDSILGFTDLSEMLDNVKPDIAVVTTPTSTHFHIVHKLLLEGVNVFVEKPFTQSVNDGNTLIQLAKKKGLKLTCGYIERFNPVTQYIEELRKTPILLEFHRESMIPTHIKDVGLVLDTSVHDIETACFLFGKYPEKITSVLKNYQNENIEDMAIITLDFGTGVASIVSNWNTHVKSRLVHATYNDIIVRGDFVQKTVEKMMHDGSSVKYRYAEANPLKAELFHFMECVRDDTEPAVSAEHANRITGIANTIVDTFRQT
jgi:UDP-N-acetylglucosamine 3-dehydrogenase